MIEETYFLIANIHAAIVVGIFAVYVVGMTYRHAKRFMNRQYTEEWLMPVVSFMAIGLFCSYAWAFVYGVLFLMAVPYLVRAVINPESKKG